MQIKTVVALASTIGCAFAYPICSFAGNYQAEDGSSQYISFNGMFFNRTQDGVAIYFDETAQLHCMGNTAYFEDNCNVIHWSSGGTWIRTSSD